jgi:hypothetical protein
MGTGIRYVLTEHAKRGMNRRGITEDEVIRVVQSPEQVEDVRPGRKVFQSRVSRGGRIYLLRVFVDVDRDPPEVVTAYRTSKIAKYWRTAL